MEVVAEDPGGVNMHNRNDAKIQLAIFLKLPHDRHMDKRSEECQRLSTLSTKQRFTAVVPTAQNLAAPIALDRCRLILRHENAAESVLAGEGEICTAPPPSSPVIVRGFDGGRS